MGPLRLVILGALKINLEGLGTNKALDNRGEGGRWLLLAVANQDLANLVSDYVVLKSEFSSFLGRSHLIFPVL